MTGCELIANDGVWFLERILSHAQLQERVPMAPPEFQVGRRLGCGLFLPAEVISRDHAEIEWHDRQPWIRDKGSMNGTFLNGRRLQSAAPLQDSDVVHFAHFGYRVCHESLRSPTLVEDTAPKKPTDGWDLDQFQQIFSETGILPVYQPIIACASGAIIGYEVLGRAQLEGLPTQPEDLFTIACRLGLEVELSRQFRDRGIETGQAIPGRPKLFVNTHPQEIASPRLLESLQQCRATFPDAAIVLEIHEASICDLRVSRKLKEELAALDIELAYDDFGIGQARFLELLEVPPNYVKFDRGLLQGIHQAPLLKVRVVRSLVRMVRELGVIAIAEGIEKLEDSIVCGQLDFDYAQGFYFGRPAPIDTFRHPVPAYETDGALRSLATGTVAS